MNPIVGRWAVLSAVIVALCAPAAHATLLSDRFGVSPELEFIENWGYRFVGSSLAPTLNTETVDYQVSDWFGTWSTTTIGQYTTYSGTYPSGDEPYDTEAYYFDDDVDNLYFAIIVGFPSPADGIFVESRNDPYGNPIDVPVVQGDFALNTPYRTGSQVDQWGFAYDYGVDLTPDNRPGSGNVTELYSDTLGNEVYETNSGWYLGTPNGAVNPVEGNESYAFTNFDPSYSGLTPLGGATVSWYELGLEYEGTPTLENSWQTYVIEMTIPRDLLVPLRPGDTLQFQWLMGCRNDGSETTAYLTGSGDIDSPEPGTLALLVLGAGPLGLWMRNRRRDES